MITTTAYQYNDDRRLRSCENNAPLKESTNLREMMGEVIPHGHIDSNSPKYSSNQANDQVTHYNYEPHFDGEDNAPEERYVPCSRGKSYPEYDSEQYATHSEHEPYVDNIEARSVDKSETSLLQELNAINRIKNDQYSSSENKKGSFFGTSSIFHCGDMMNVLNENGRKGETYDGPIYRNHFDNTSSLLFMLLISYISISSIHKGDFM